MLRLWGSKPNELALGQEFRLRNAGTTGIVGKKLGEGGQGVVHMCDVGGRQLALKWYHPHVVQIDSTLRARIERLVSEEPPDKRFLFPIDLATIPGRPEFGYVMPVVSDDRRPLSDMKEPPPKRLVLTLETWATVCYEIAESFQNLHTRGLCYQDINFGGFFIDPIRGGVLICDPDNITGEGLLGGVLGARGFMAPEVVRGEAIPSSRTDLYSMAVLFFQVLFQWHPLHGQREASLKTRSAETLTEFYRSEPPFIFDPSDGTNRLPSGDPFFTWLTARWNAMPSGLRDLFTRSFTKGIRNPDERVVELEWRAAMARLRDAVTRCPSCSFEVPLEPAAAGAPQPHCSACGEVVPRPIRMTLGRYLVPMLPTRQLFAHHVDGTAAITLRDSVASVDVHPTDETMVGLRNLTPTPWQGRTGDGKPVVIVPGRTVRILDGLGIDFGRREGLVAGADQVTKTAA